MPWLQLVFDELFCQDTKKEQLLDINYHYIRLPIALPEGLYSISFHLSARNSSQVIKVEDQLHYIYSIEASSTSSNLQIPFHYQLLAPNYGSIISRKVKILFYPNFHALNSYEGVVMSIDGVLNNWLGNTADIVATETDLEPASWFITLLPVQSGEIIHNLQYQLAVSASPVKETLTASLLSRSRYLQNFNISPHLESFIPYENIIHGYPTYHYLEVVLTDEEILQQRLFVSHLFKSYQRSSRDLALQLIQEKLHWKRKLQLIFQDRRYYRKPSPFLAENKVNNGEDNQRKSNQQRNRKGSTSKQIPSDSTGFINVCITGGNDMDGQKRIWLQQAEHLDANKYQFYYLMSLHNGMTTSQLHEAYDPHSKKNTVYYYLQQLIREKNRTNIHIADSRYNTHLISMEDIEDIPFGETLSASMIWQQNKTKLYEYLHSRYELAEGNLENITPSWCKLFYSQMKEELIQNECHMIVYGNARGFNTDIFITDVSRSLGIPSITELLNLYLDDRIIPDVIVAPSHHSLLHPTIQDPIISNQYNYHYQYPPLQVVIQPSVNPRFFDSSPYRDTPSVIPAKSCSRMNGYRFPYSISKEVDVFVKHYPCILIGFIARISNEKNPGLFVQMAYHLLQKFPFVRFRFIGNGIVKEQVELLTKRLNIDYAIDFVGWISSEDLPRHLADIDIVVNPSLRGWSETFCISNIEIMSMGIPLVTFAVGGIGEYVTAPASWTKWKSKEGKTVMHKKSSIEIFPASWQRMEEDGDDTLTDEVNEEREGARDIPPFEVVDNALLLNTADPRQMSEALFYLITHPPIAKNIGEAGRRSIEHYFTTVRQIQQYDHLYHSIYETRWGPLSK